MIYKAIGKQMATSVEQVEQVVKSCLSYGLFIQDDNEFYSERVNENIETRDEISALRSKAGKESAKKRANLTPVEQVSTNDEQNPTKESKGKEKKVKEIKENVWPDEILYNTLKKDYPKLFLLKYPLQFEEHQKLIKQFKPIDVKQIYSEMQNYALLDKKSESAYLTANNWLNRNSKKGLIDVR